MTDRDEKLLELAARLRKSLRMDRSQEPFFAEIDEIERTMRKLAREERAAQFGRRFGG